jgi:hypothetical protein
MGKLAATQTYILRTDMSWLPQQDEQLISRNKVDDRLPFLAYELQQTLSCHQVQRSSPEPSLLHRCWWWGACR